MVEGELARATYRRICKKFEVSSFFGITRETQNYRSRPKKRIFKTTFQKTFLAGLFLFTLTELKIQ
jgi:hypothetical protein